MSNAARILIVDDSSVTRLKLRKAAEALGHLAILAVDGPSGLELAAAERPDLVLLDIVMPEMDGFDVLRRLKASSSTRDVPVIVISGLDGDMESVVRAIEAGAEDFLPKDFAPALFRARVSACVEKKRLRDVELAYLRQVARLTRAATVLETGRFDPDRLGLSDIAARPDALGKLASVFSAMARQVHERERRLRRAIRTFQGALLLLLAGALWGLLAPLAKVAANVATHPVGLTLVVSALGALICLGISAWTGGLGAVARLTRSDWIRLAVWALLCIVINRTLVALLASRLPASTVSIAILLEGFSVFALAAAIGIERASAKRFLGLLVGLVGVGVIVTAGIESGAADWRWFALAMVIPVTYAVEDLWIALRRPTSIDTPTAFALVQAMACVVLAPLAVATGDVIPAGTLLGPMLPVVLGMAVAAQAAMIVYVKLVATTGAVFASQAAYAITAAGIAWRVMLLGETIPLWTWGGLALVVLGLVLVEPKQEAEEEPPPLADEPEALGAAATAA